MSRLEAALHALRRSREVGVRGVARRLVEPARQWRRLRAQDRWRTRFARPLAESDLIALGLPSAHVGPGALEALARVIGRGSFLFDGRDTPLRQMFGERHPAARAALIDQAEAALAGDLSFVVPGGSPDWHAALPGGGRWPLAAPEAAGIGADRPPGDVRLTWEVGRCAHLVRLAQAAWLTRDERFAKGAVDGLRSWVDANPPGVGIGWAHAQEAGLRAVAWLWVFTLIRDFPPFDRDAFRLWLGATLQHGEFVRAHLSDHVLTHNHLISELGALALLGLALPELRPAAAWRRIGVEGLCREILKQVDEEGVQGELSTHYHAFTLDSCLVVLLATEVAGASLPRAVRDRVATMCDYVALLLRSDGTLPAIGDTDSGRAFRLGTEPLDRRDALAAAAVAFDREEWGAIAGDAPGAFWLTGGRPVPGAGNPPPGPRARRLESAGIVAARTGYDPDAEIVVFRAGATRFRRDVHTSHAHADALSVLFRAAGEDVLVDPGVYLYSEGAGWRAAFRRTSSHSCVTLDGRDQADVTSHRFGVFGLRPARWVQLLAKPGVLVAAAEHPAGGDSSVLRRVVWLAGGTLVLCDDFLGVGRHEVVSWLQLPETTGDAEGSHADLVLSGGARVRIQVLGAPALLACLRPHPGDDPGAGWRAPRYGVLVPGTALRASFGATRLPARSVTVLQVARLGVGQADARLETLAGGAGRVTVAGRGITLPPIGETDAAVEIAS